MRRLLEPRPHYRPYEYPELLSFRDAIRQSYWTHLEYSYSADVQDHALVDDRTRLLVERALAAVAQVELSVKLFWARAYDRLPKPEIAEVGMTFAESEVRHANAYAHLLDLLDLNEAFERALRGSPLALRHEELQGILKRSKGNLRDWTLALLLFSAYTEFTALFTAFYALMALNKRGNLYKGTANAIEATSKEENLHGHFGVQLLKLLRQEEPTLFDEDWTALALGQAERFLRAEEEILDWIFAGGDNPWVGREETRTFIRDRLNRVLELHGLPAPFPVDRKELKDTEWFDLELIASKEVDFFNKRSVAYTRKARTFSAEELF